MSTSDSRARWAIEKGQRFGALVAVQYMGEGRRSARWMFLCDCGRDKTIASRYVIRFGAVDCGCNRGSASDDSDDLAPYRGITVGSMVDIARREGIAAAVCAMIAVTRAPIPEASIQAETM